MKLNLKDSPREWRKTTLLTVFGLGLISSLLRWRHVLVQPIWLVILGMLAAVGAAALLRPRWFRGYHLFSMRLGFAISQFIGRILLIMFFLLILTPVGLVLRLSGKDLLQLKKRQVAASYWQKSRDSSPLDRLF
ncbi:MAG: hypothetical protein WBQ21_10005 [Solirubrobacteraceae bacterium]